MKKIDRLGWAVGMAISAYGLRIGIRTNRWETLDALIPSLPPGWKAADTPVVERMFSVIQGGAVQPGRRQFNLFYFDSVRAARSLDFEEVRAAFESHVQFYVAEFAHRRVFVHAGVVGWKDRAILIPGLSHSGKSTLVAELVGRGATYYSDEYAVLDRRGRVHPYPRPLGLRAERGTRPVPHTINDLGGSCGVKPLPVGLVVVSRYRPRAKWRPVALTPGQGILETMANTVSAWHKPREVIATLRQAMAGVRVIKGSRGEACEMADNLLAQAAPE